VIEAGVRTTGVAGDPIAAFRRTGEHLPTALREQIRSLGPAAIPALIEILRDEELGAEDGPSDGWPPATS
jgi:hypothetical protein